MQIQHAYGEEAEVAVTLWIDNAWHLDPQRVCADLEWYGPLVYGAKHICGGSAFVFFNLLPSPS